MSTSTTGISWTDRTWNPVRGCSLVSPGCTNCYAMKLAHRFSGKGQPYEGLTRMTEHGPVWTGKIKLVEHALDEPLKWERPARVFVNSMSDLFHEDVPWEFLNSVLGHMLSARRHTFQILTKRPQRMADYIAGFTRNGIPFGEFAPNVWLGVSVENQETANERIPILLQTPAAVRFLSVEPLLGPVELGDWKLDLDWVIVGGESGPHHRDCDPTWIESVARHCQRAGLPVWVKQDAGRRSGQQGRLSDEIWALKEFPS